MTIDPALLAAVIAAPDDDLIRLQVADWLDEHGRPERAEFIRVQCELAKLNAGVDEPVGDTPEEVDRKWVARDDQIERLRSRERELLEDHGWDWIPRSVASDGQPSGYTFARGFVSQIKVTWQFWSDHAAAILAACPIRRVNRAKPRTCPYCSGEGCATHGHGDWTRKCDGSGKLPPAEPDWRGDGVVRLTTFPDVGYTFDQARLWYKGKLVMADAPHPSRTRYEIENVMAVLKVAEPGVWFEPAAYPSAIPFYPPVLRAETDP